MDSVTVKTDELLHVLEDNRGKHKDLFEQAWKGYRKKVIDETERGLAAMKDGGVMFLGAGFTQPSDHTNDYNCVIKMLEMTLAAGEDTIEISNGDFQRFAMDDWGWSEAFMTSNTLYTLD